ncbi:CRAL-TRIO domain-containing protein [Aspergillus chevalieri]|uniref:CRAL-TRIO domain-containing protein n=1 Tax=Aspergillus chevalieri TaxID=182096 RepID=A0A7R7ZKG5_ASPCH|nr:uncharacterized protein ACHE_20856S [Aspergillus chevalieri]BCR85398.1 hypothetical protein ACHE_20856S [Aspergillus chevalieri]
MTDRPDPSVPVTNSVYLVEASVISLKQAWDLKDFAQDVSWILATCYPETIDRIFVCNVSSYITTIWGVLKKFVDPVTAEKIVFLKSNDVSPTLEKYIDPENIPSQLGGRFTFTNGMLPDLDTGIRNALHWTTPSDGSDTGSLPPGPIKWVQDEGGRREAVATGSVGGLQRTERVAVLGS